MTRAAALAAPARIGRRAGFSARLARVEVPEPIALVLALVGGFFLGMARNPSVLLHPELWAEDGAIWFQNAYDRGWFMPLLQPHTGYLQTFPRVVADAGLLVPLSSLPLLFAVVALLVQSLPAVLFASRRFAHLVGSQRVRLVLATLYLVVPNASEVNANLTNAQWHLGLAAFLVVAALPAGRIWRVLDVLVLVLSGLTGPFCLALLPLALVLAWRRGGRVRWVNASIVLACALVQAYELLTSVRDHLAGLGASIARLVEILGGQVVLGTSLGSSTLASAQNGSHFLLWSSLAAALAAVLLVFVLVRAPLEIVCLNAFAALVLAGALASPVISGRVPQWLVLAEDPSIRYWFLPAVVLVFDVVWLTSRRGLFGACGLALLALIVCFGVREDFGFTPLRRLDWSQEARQAAQTPAGHRVVLPIDPRGWRLVLVKH